MYTRTCARKSVYMCMHVLDGGPCVALVGRAGSLSGRGLRPRGPNDGAQTSMYAVPAQVRSAVLAVVVTSVVTSIAVVVSLVLRVVASLALPAHMPTAIAAARQMAPQYH